MFSQTAIFIALLVATCVGLYVFREGFGLVVFLFAGLATLVQGIRVLASVGRSETLKTWWQFFKDAFWGIG